MTCSEALPARPDTDAYGSGDAAFGRANADLLDRLLARLRDRDPGARLLTVTSDYQGTADTDYLRGLREHLARGIEVMWTGPGTESRPVLGHGGRPVRAARSGGRRWSGRTGPPTTRLAPTPSIRRGSSSVPTRGRAGVVGHVGGFFFNPANQADLNLLAAGHRGPLDARSRRVTGRAEPSCTRRGDLRGARRRRCAPSRRRTTHRACAAASRPRRWSGSFAASCVPAPDKRAPGGLIARPPSLTCATSCISRPMLAGGCCGSERCIHFVRQARPFLRSVRLNAPPGSSRPISWRQSSAPSSFTCAAICTERCAARRAGLRRASGPAPASTG